MSEEDSRVESWFLLFSAFGNLAIGILALVFTYFTGSQAIQLDGVFNITYFLTGLFALWVLRLLHEGDNPEFPFGYMYLEPLTNGIKGSLVLGIALYSGFDATEAILVGGRPISAGFAIVYGVLATIVCWLLAWVSHRGFVKTESPLLDVDQKNWVINAAISSCVLVGFVVAYLAEGSSWVSSLPYFDPVLVLAVVLLFIWVPVRMCWDALMALLNRTPEGLFEQMEPFVIEALSGVPFEKVYVRAIRPGRTCYVLVHVILREELPLLRLDQFREHVGRILSEKYKDIAIDIVWTCDPKWGMTLSEAREAGLVSGR